MPEPINLSDTLPLETVPATAPQGNGRHSTNPNAIRIRGARQHNLKNIDLELPRDRLIVFTGVSGSGKSSLAFDTIFAEGQRRYVESLSAYARQFLGQLDKPDVDAIEGLSPAISIDQKSTSHNPRSSVGTVTEIYDYLRLLFGRAGVAHCPICDRNIAPQTKCAIASWNSPTALAFKSLLLWFGAKKVPTRNSSPVSPRKDLSA
jgi:excinuclease ABC subunit A